MNIVKFLLTVLISAMAMLSMTNTTYAEEVNINEVAYINGGVGQEDADNIRAKAGQYNLRLYLSEGKLGQFITNVPVIITDKSGNVTLNYTDSGPMLFLQVEKGNYTISAQHNGVTLTKNVSVINQRGVNVYLNWKNTEVDIENEQ